MACHFFSCSLFFFSSFKQVSSWSDQWAVSSGKAGTLTGCLCGPTSLWFDAEQYKMSHALIPLGSVHPPVLQPFGFQWLVSASRHASLLSNPLLSPSVVPSDGMIAIADICRLSWWSCMKTNDGRSRRRLSKVQWHDAGKSSNEQKGCNGKKNGMRGDKTDWRSGGGERRREAEKKEQLRADFASDGHITASHPQSTWVVGAFCQTHYVSCPLRHFMENVNVFAATAGL